MKKRIVLILKYAALVLIVLMFLLPIVYMLANSVMPTKEITDAYTTSPDHYASFHLIPDRFSLEQYYQAFLRRPQFLNLFWNSVLITVPIVIIQTVVSIFAAFAFTKLKFPFRDALFFIFIILLIMPSWVTMVPNYMMIQRLGLLDTIWSLILPSAFTAFGVCLLRQYMRYVPDETIEAARIDGASTLKILFRIVLPQVKGGVAALMILTFIDNWNMVEQVIVFITDEEKYPLSVALSSFSSSDPGVIFACGVIFMIPPLLLYLYHSKEFKNSKV
ncbi:MAG: carbohydrate ABC transporter permease [Ruminococcus sp.]|nr:carbohydrate ABC transporter permease [Ruminococcus sp.]